MLRLLIKIDNEIINKIQGRILVSHRLKFWIPQTAEKTTGLFAPP